MVEENIVKVVSRYAVGGVTLHIIWRLFVFRYTYKPRHKNTLRRTLNTGRGGKAEKNRRRWGSYRYLVLRTTFCAYVAMYVVCIFIYSRKKNRE